MSMCNALHPGHGYQSPPSRMPQPGKENGGRNWCALLLRAEGGEEEVQVGLEATEDGSAPKAEAVVLPLPAYQDLVTVTSSLPEACTVPVQQRKPVHMKSDRPAVSASTGRKRTPPRALYGAWCLRILKHGT